jgi:glutamate--cysteine ligase
VRDADVFAFVADRCLPPTAGGLVGIEVEFFPVPTEDCACRLPWDVVRAAVADLGALPGGSVVSFEPGGQIELSSPPQQGSAAACIGLQSDLAVVRRCLGDRGISLVGTGLHPRWTSERCLSASRYRAMETYFDQVEASAGLPRPAWGPPGRTMMTLTAAVQVSVDLGPAPERTWRLAHDLGPVLVAAFANSPLALGRPTGFRSTRFANWWELDPTRTRPIGSIGGAVLATARYALAAPVMGTLTDGPAAELQPLTERLTFRQWMRDGYHGDRPDAADFAYHLTTLFPPVRPRGWLELRMIDALPGSTWEVPVAVTAALLADPGGADARLSDAAALWPEAARHGLRHPVLAATARRAFAVAAEVLDGAPEERVLADAVRAYAERYVDRSRCPADDALDLWQRTGHCSETSPPVGV